MSPSDLAKPTIDSRRIASIDVLRGLAMLGILVLNIQIFSMPFEAYGNPFAFGDLEGSNYWVFTLSMVLADMKFMAIFSMLFGAGMVLFIERLLETFWRNPVHAAKRQSDPDGLLCATLAYSHERMGSLADVCAICDAPLAFGEASILPSVCGRPLCAHQLETFGKLLVWRLRGNQLTRVRAVEQASCRWRYDLGFYTGRCHLPRREGRRPRPARRDDAARGAVAARGGHPAAVRLRRGNQSVGPVLRETFASVAWNQSVDCTQALRPRRHERRRGGRGEDPRPLPVLRADPRDGAQRRPVGRRLRGRRGRVAQGR